ncbi:hypothetical protein H5P28_02830 [Ruficoccus amylovorans]|uniref:Porin n=1 Tax=Ruficoccus amylovorans TaxID=1804625 RepID=A0A842HC43_9BACT|nr:hypothetical protein [Ruficoccus amylovorans]MBC2593187.1 hypothetical protein [Ruficoccus amylovorans]
MKLKLIVTILLLCPIALPGQGTPESVAASNELLMQKLEAMERRITQLEGEVNALRAENERLQEKPPAVATAAAHAALPVGASPSAAESHPPTDGAPTALTPATASTAVSAAKVPVEHAPANVPEGYFPVTKGVYANISLIAQADVIVDTNNANSPGSFVTSSLPVKGQPNYGSGLNSDVSFRQSTLAFDLLFETGDKPLTFFYANNFFPNGQPANGYGYYLLGFYAEWNGLLIGYDWTALMDAGVDPNTLDYEGPNSLPEKYNAQVRYTRTLLEDDFANLIGKISLEQASPSISGVAGGMDVFQQAPDGVLALRAVGDDWHVQAGVVLRSLVAQTPSGDTGALGWGFSLSGSWQFTEKDEVMLWGNIGDGFADYIQDAYGLGLDGYINASNQLETIRVYGVGAAYQHNWTRHLSSTFSFGYVNISDEGLGPYVGATNMRETLYSSGNIVWQATPFLVVGAELLYGRKLAVNGESGDDFRVQSTVRYTFNP